MKHEMYRKNKIYLLNTLKILPSHLSDRPTKTKTRVAVAENGNKIKNKTTFLFLSSRYAYVVLYISIWSSIKSENWYLSIC